MRTVGLVLSASILFPLLPLPLGLGLLKPHKRQKVDKPGGRCGTATTLPSCLRTGRGGRRRFPFVKGKLIHWKPWQVHALEIFRHTAVFPSQQLFPRLFYSSFSCYPRCSRLNIGLVWLQLGCSWDFLHAEASLAGRAMQAVIQK